MICARQKLPVNAASTCNQAPFHPVSFNENWEARQSEGRRELVVHFGPSHSTGIGGREGAASHSSVVLKQKPVSQPPGWAQFLTQHLGDEGSRVCISSRFPGNGDSENHSPKQSRTGRTLLLPTRRDGRDRIPGPALECNICSETEIPPGAFVSLESLM